MSEIEVGFKLLQSKKEVEKILLENGFVNTFKTHTRDVYFGKNFCIEDKSEEQVKKKFDKVSQF